jgi:hypothetical protein
MSDLYREWCPFPADEVPLLGYPCVHCQKRTGTCEYIKPPIE